VDGYPRFLLGEITDRSLFINRRGPEREQEAGGNLNNPRKISLSHACTAMQIFLDFKTFPHPLISRYISEPIPLQLKKIVCYQERITAVNPLLVVFTCSLLHLYSDH